METEYQQKLTTAKEAAKAVRSGDRVFLGCSSSISYVMAQALWDRKDELEGVELSISNLMKPSPICGQEDSPFRLCSPFLGPGERAAQKNGRDVDFTSVHLSQVDVWCRMVCPDVCILAVSPPNEEGYMSFGPGGGALNIFTLESARTIIAHVNRQIPYVTGQACRIHISEVDMIIEAEDSLPEVGEEPVDEVTQRISDHILEMVPDGATIQLGIGKLSTAIGYGLKQRNDLGVYSELFNDPLMHLIKNGNVTNRKKGYFDGLSVFSFAVGSRELYDFIDCRNSQLYCGTFPFVNDARNIAKNKRMISINSAMAVDLYGQVAADSLGWKQHSGVGGQIDFVKGAQWSDGGKSIIATASSFIKDGVRRSKIMLHFPVGTAVTTARSEVQYVATEYGIVNLKRLTMQERVNAMISLAHPEFREQLREEAKAHHLI